MVFFIFAIIAFDRFPKYLFDIKPNSNVLESFGWEDFKLYSIYSNLLNLSRILFHKALVKEFLTSSTLCGMLKSGANALFPSHMVSINC